MGRERVQEERQNSPPMCHPFVYLFFREKALDAKKNINAIEVAVRKILLMQAHSFFLGGVPMIFYGDETGHVNDYSYKNDTGKSYDNRWMHRPMIDWKKNKNIDKRGTIEQKIFLATQKLISIRKKLDVVADKKNLHGSRHIIFISQGISGLLKTKDYTAYSTFATGRSILHGMPSVSMVTIRINCMTTGMRKLLSPVKIMSI